jgi:phosphoribosylamine-glycine ligase
LPVVIKADGLAAGKGVYIAQQKKKPKKPSMKFSMVNLVIQKQF